MNGKYLFCTGSDLRKDLNPGHGMTNDNIDSDKKTDSTSSTVAAQIIGVKWNSHASESPSSSPTWKLVCARGRGRGAHLRRSQHNAELESLPPIIEKEVDVGFSILREEDIHFEPKQFNRYASGSGTTDDRIAALRQLRAEVVTEFENKPVVKQGKGRGAFFAEYHYRKYVAKSEN